MKRQAPPIMTALLPALPAFSAPFMSTDENRIIKQHLPMVKRLAVQLMARLPANVQLDDLIQVGMMGLLDAVRRYQQMDQAQFETYAQTRIRGAMLDELRTQDWLPRAARGKARQIEVVIQRLSHALLRPPTEREIAAELGLDLAQYHALLEQAHGLQLVHMEDLRQAQDSQGDLDLKQDGDTDPFTLLNHQRLRGKLVELIEALPERERLLLALQFEQDLSQKEISLVLDISEGRVSQLRTQAIARIRAALSESDWLQDVDAQALEKLL